MRKHHQPQEDVWQTPTRRSGQTRKPTSTIHGTRNLRFLIRNRWKETAKKQSVSTTNKGEEILLLK